MRISPKTSEKPEDSRNSRPPKAMLFSVWMIQNCMDCSLSPRAVRRAQPKCMPQARSTCTAGVSGERRGSAMLALAGCTACGHDAAHSKFFAGG